MRKITIIQGHPLADSFCSALTECYQAGAQAAGAEVRLHRVAELDYDPLLHDAYRSIQPLEPDLLQLQESIRWCEHLVVAFPVWWGTPPAILKGFFDRAFVPGFAFRYAGPKSLFQQKLLAGRSARIICTMDSPSWYFRLCMGAPGIRMMKRSVLKFCGFSPVGVSAFGSVKLASDGKRQSWLRRAESLGGRDASRPVRPK